ncbi:MAG TPA: YfhO family protein [Bryobacteraceae bacterium]|nr:YfhO family protein [Bryobacteraceae bacterium]
MASAQEQLEGSRWRGLIDRYASRFALLLLIAQPLLFFKKVLFNPRAHIPFDIEQFHLPLATYIARCVRQGVFPFWDPYPYCGVPIHADIQAQLFYPLSWISIVLGNLSEGHKLYYWLEWQIPLHMILAGVLTFFLLRHLGSSVPSALFGGTVYQLGGYFASQAQHLGAICCGAWLPLVLLCVWKLSAGIDVRWVATLGCGIALIFLAGFPAATMVVLGAAGFLAVALVLSRRTNWKLFAALGYSGALGIGIAAVQLVPTYQLSRLSVASMRSLWYVSGEGLRIQSLASLIVPNYYHIFTPFDPTLYKLPINFTFLYVYCGLVTVALLAVAPFLRRTPYLRMLFLLTLISAIWMLGKTTPFYPFVFRHLPGFIRGVLYAEYALMAFCMFAALTSTLTLERVTARAPRWLCWGIALLTAVDLTHFGAERPMNNYAGSYKAENSEYDITGYPGSLTRIQKLLDGTNPPVRIDYVDRGADTFVWGPNMLRLATPNGDNPLVLRRVLSLRRLFCAGLDWERQRNVSNPSSPLVRMLNVGFLASSAFPFTQELAPEHLPLTADIAGLRFYRKPDPLPRFFLVRRLHIVNGPDEAFSYLGRADFAPGEEAVVESQELGPDGPLGGGTVQVGLYSANRIDLNVVADGRAFLATSETLYPGWTATINGKPTHFHMTNGAFRGLMLDGGVNRIVMTYWPERYLLWASISVASVLSVIAALVLGGPFTWR